MRVELRLRRVLSVLVLLVATGCASLAPRGAVPSGTFTLWQLPERGKAQMMSYILRTPSGQVVVIDGGTRQEAKYLRKFLRRLGGRVELWFITHPHFDHVGALIELLRQPRGLTIGQLYAALPPAEWVTEHTSADEAWIVEAFRNAAARAREEVLTPSPGQELQLDGLRIEVLAGMNPEIVENAINNSSVVLRVSDEAKAVLFLGDLGAEGGAKLLRGSNRDRLRADYVQMAHHGQDGVGRDVYVAIAPRACLWPTPRWLWENDDGGGRGSGPWKTLEVRGWMEELGVSRHYRMAEGLQRID